MVRDWDFKQIIFAHGTNPYTEDAAAAFRCQSKTTMTLTFETEKKGNLQGVPSDRGWGVDFDIGSSTVCPSQLRQMGFWQKWLSQLAIWWTITNLIQLN